MLTNGSCTPVGHNTPTLYYNYYYAGFVECQQFAQDFRETEQQHYSSIQEGGEGPAPESLQSNRHLISQWHRDMLLF